MKTITKEQFLNLIRQSFLSKNSAIQSLPQKVRDDIDSIRAHSKYNNVYLLLTHPEGQDQYFLDYVDVDNMKAREMYETELHAQVNRGCIVAV
jgi:hypothetical protein